VEEKAVGEVVSLDKFRQKKKTESKPLPPVGPDTDLQTRLTRIKENIGRINTLMGELGRLSDERKNIPATRRVDQRDTWDQGDKK
jgi:hypothetical protein